MQKRILIVIAAIATIMFANGAANARGISAINTTLLPDNTKEIMCVYLFNSALEKNVSFIENVPCGCSSYCNSSFDKKGSCEGFHLFCAMSAFSIDKDGVEWSATAEKVLETDGEDEVEGSDGEDSVTVKSEEKRSGDIPFAYDASFCPTQLGKYLNEKINVEDVPCICADQCVAREKACFLLKLSCVQSEEDEIETLFNDKDYEYGEPYSG